MKEPLVSVILPAYNAEKYLPEAIDSILQQTYKNFELLIINDGSTDSTEQIILGYHDPRIKYIRNETNLGLIATLNKGIEKSSGDFIARMDADDVSLPLRFEKQVQYMTERKDVGAAGSWFINFSGNKERKRKLRDDSDFLKTQLLFNSCFCHPSVMIRRSVLMQNNIRYNPDYIHAEDLDLWIQIGKHSALGNVQEFLFRYRSHTAQVSEKHNQQQRISAARIRKSYLEHLEFRSDEKDLSIHEFISNNGFFTSKEQLKHAEEWLASLVTQNKGNRISKKGFNALIGKIWFDCCGMSNLGLWAYNYFKRSPLSAYFPFTAQKKTLLLGKCLIRKFSE